MMAKQYSESKPGGLAPPRTHCGEWLEADAWAHPGKLPGPGSAGAVLAPLLHLALISQPH